MNPPTQRPTAADSRADEIAANREIAAKAGGYRAEDILALAEKGAELGILFHVAGFPFGEYRFREAR